MSESPRGKREESAMARFRRAIRQTAHAGIAAGALAGSSPPIDRIEPSQRPAIEDAKAPQMSRDHGKVTTQGPLIQEQYPRMDSEAAIRAWDLIGRSSPFDPESWRRAHAFVNEVFGQLQTDSERSSFMEKFVATAPAYEPNFASLFLRKYPWWASGPRSEEVMQTLVRQLVAEYDTRSVKMLIDPVERSRIGSQSGFEQLDTAIAIAFPSAVFEHYPHFSKYSWISKQQQENAYRSPDAALAYFKTYRDLDSAKETFRIAAKFSDPVLALHFLEIEQARGTFAKEEMDAMLAAIPKDLSSRVALLANAIRVSYHLLGEDPALKELDKVDRSLVVPLMLHPDTDEAWWTAQADVLKRFPSSKHFNTGEKKLALLRGISERNGGVNPIELEESAAIVARNLHTKGIPVTPQSVRDEVKRVLSMRESLAKLDMFDRDILLVSHDELLSRNTDVRKVGDLRFGTRALEEALRTRQARSGKAYTFERATPAVEKDGAYSSSEQSLRDAKQKMLDVVKGSLAPRTVLFSGHGDEGSLSFTDNQPAGGPVYNDYASDDQERGRTGTDEARRRAADEYRANSSISVQELADALEARSQAQGGGPSNLIFVFSACDMQAFARSLADELRKRGVPLPQLMAIANEFGQPGISDLNSPIGGAFLEYLVRNPVLGSALGGQDTQLDTNPTFIVPEKEDQTVPMQLGGNQHQHTPANAVA